MEQKREIAMMRSYMASEKTAAQESATHANHIHREASKQISAYQQQVRGIDSSTSIEKFNEEEMVQNLKSQLVHALVKRPEVYSMEDTREQLMTRLNDVTAFAEQESKRAECLLREKEEIVKQYESDVSKKDQMIAIEGGHRQDAIIELAQIWEATREERCTMDEKSKEAEFWKSRTRGRGIEKRGRNGIHSHLAKDPSARYLEDATADERAERMCRSGYRHMDKMAGSGSRVKPSPERLRR